MELTLPSPASRKRCSQQGFLAVGMHARQNCSLHPLCTQLLPMQLQPGEVTHVLGNGNPHLPNSPLPHAPVCPLPTASHTAGKEPTPSLLRAGQLVITQPAFLLAF